MSPSPVFGLLECPAMSTYRVMSTKEVLKADLLHISLDTGSFCHCLSYFNFVLNFSLHHSVME